MTAVLVARRYDDATVFFGPIVPAVAPLLGLGAPVAVLSALVAGAAGWSAPGRAEPVVDRRPGFARRSLMI